MTVSILIASGLLAMQPYEMLKIPTTDAEVIVGRLSLPSEGVKNVVVVDVPGSGPNTYENRRRIGRTTEVHFHDLSAAEFARRGVAYFSYNTRYTDVDEHTPPTFDRVDKARFWTITPTERIQDLENIVRHLRKNPRLARCRVLLLEWSEGTIIAGLVAERKQVLIDFHGTNDANCPLQGVIDIGNTARAGGRANLRTFIVPDHDHSLEFVAWAVSGSLPEGVKILFDQVER